MYSYGPALDGIMDGKRWGRRHRLERHRRGDRHANARRITFPTRLTLDELRLEALLAERRERIVDATNRLRIADPELIAAAGNQAIEHGYRVEQPERRHPFEFATFAALVHRSSHTREGFAVLGLRYVRRQKIRDRLGRGITKGPPRQVYATTTPSLRCPLRFDVYLVGSEGGARVILVEDVEDDQTKRGQDAGKDGRSSHHPEKDGPPP